MLLNWATLCSVKNRHVNSSLLNSRSSLFVCRQEGVPGPYDSRLPLPLASQFGSKHPTVEGLWGEEWTWSTCKLKKFGHWFLSGPADDTTTASEKWFKLVCGQKFGCDHFIYTLSLWWNAANLPCRVEIQANLESFPKKKIPPACLLLLRLEMVKILHLLWPQHCPHRRPRLAVSMLLIWRNWENICTGRLGAVACNYLPLSYADKEEMLCLKKLLIWVLRGKMHVSVKLGISFQTLPSESCDNENNVSC